MEQEFINHKRYSHSIRRLHKRKLPTNQQGKHGHLPPIEGTLHSADDRERNVNDGGGDDG